MANGAVVSMVQTASKLLNLFPVPGNSGNLHRIRGQLEYLVLRSLSCCPPRRVAPGVLPSSRSSLAQEGHEFFFSQKQAPLAGGANQPDNVSVFRSSIYDATKVQLSFTAKVETLACFYG